MMLVTMLDAAFVALALGILIGGIRDRLRTGHGSSTLSPKEQERAAWLKTNAEARDWNAGGPDERNR